MYYFMPMRLSPLGDGRQFLVAYELEDPKPRIHLLVPGIPAIVLPFPWQTMSNLTRHELKAPYNYIIC